MSAPIEDVRFSLRLFRRNPGFALIAIATLALAIGANTAMFTVVHGVLLQPLPYPDADRLVMVYESTPTAEQSSIAYPNFLDWRRESDSFVDIAVFRSDDFNLTGRVGLSISRARTCPLDCCAS